MKLSEKSKIEDLVDAVAKMGIPVGVRRPVVEDKGSPLFRLLHWYGFVLVQIAELGSLREIENENLAIFLNQQQLYLLQLQLQLSRVLHRELTFGQIQGLTVGHLLLGLLRGRIHTGGSQRRQTAPGGIEATPGHQQLR